MRHVVVHDINHFALEETANPTLQADTDAIVKVNATSICGSDVHLLSGDMGTPWGFPLGHEFVGIVHEVGAKVQSVKVGDRVVAAPAVWCGQCDKCCSKQTQTCSNFAIFGSGKSFGSLCGAQADFVRVPWADNCLAIIPDSISDAQALTVGDILSTGWTAIEHAVHATSPTLVVFGAGPIGLSAIHTARLQGVAQIIAVDIIPDRLKVASQLGASYVINSQEADLGEVVSRLTGGYGAEAVVDAAGVKSSIEAWVSVAAVGARIAMIAVPSGPIEMPLGLLQMKNVTVWVGLGDPSQRRMNALLRHIQNGVLDPSPIFTETIVFEDILSGLRDFISRKPGLIKPLIVF